MYGVVIHSIPFLTAGVMHFHYYIKYLIVQYSIYAEHSLLCNISYIQHTKDC